MKHKYTSSESYLKNKWKICCSKILFLHKNHYKNEVPARTKLQKIFTRLWLFVICKKIGDKYGKKLMDTATKTGIDAAKTTSKRVVQKTADATRDLIGNKIADKITLVVKSKSRQKKRK